MLSGLAVAATDGQIAVCPLAVVRATWVLATEQKRDRSSSMAVPPRSWNERNWVHDEKPIVNQGVTAVQYC